MANLNIMHQGDMLIHTTLIMLIFIRLQQVYTVSFINSKVLSIYQCTQNHAKHQFDLDRHTCIYLKDEGSYLY